jgi:hypothetical protein
MKITIEATSTITLIEGVPCRKWTGVTDTGIECSVFTRLILVPIESVTDLDGSPLEYLPRPPKLSNGNIQPGVESVPQVSNGLM